MIDRLTLYWLPNVRKRCACLFVSNAIIASLIPTQILDVEKIKTKVWWKSLRKTSQPHIFKGLIAHLLIALYFNRTVPKTQQNFSRQSVSFKLFIPSPFPTHYRQLFSIVYFLFKCKCSTICENRNGFTDFSRHSNELCFTWRFSLFKQNITVKKTPKDLRSSRLKD